MSNSILGGIGNLVGWPTPTSATSSPNTGGYSSQLGGVDLHSQLEAVRRTQEIKEQSKMVQDGDIVIRKVRNGYRVIRVSHGPNAYASTAPVVGDEYVALDLDAVGDVIKLAMVNSRLDEVTK